MKIIEKEYGLLYESMTLRKHYINVPDYAKARRMQKKQNEVYKKWKFYNRLRKALEKGEKNERYSI